MGSLYEESSYYRMLFAERTHDLPFYLRATEGAAEVLELGAGEGRVTLALAEAGHRVLGVDLSEPMLAALEERRATAPPEVAARVTVRAGDTRTIRLGRTFGRVICPFNGLAHFHDDEGQRAFFDTVRAHLGPSARFAFDVAIPNPALLGGGASSVPWLRHPRTGAVCRLEERYDYDPLAQVLTITTTIVDREEGAEQVLTLALRQLFPEETRALLDRHRFEIVEQVDLGDSLAYVCIPR